MVKSKRARRSGSKGAGTSTVEDTMRADAWMSRHNTVLLVMVVVVVGVASGLAVLLFKDIAETTGQASDSATTGGATEDKAPTTIIERVKANTSAYTAAIVILSVLLVVALIMLIVRYNRKGSEGRIVDLYRKAARIKKHARIAGVTLEQLEGTEKAGILRKTVFNPAKMELKRTMGQLSDALRDYERRYGEEGLRSIKMVGQNTWETHGGEKRGSD